MKTLVKVLSFDKQTNIVHYAELDKNTKKVMIKDYMFLPDFIKAVELENYGFTIHSTKAPTIKLKKVNDHEKVVDINNCSIAYFCNYASVYHPKHECKLNYSNKKLISFAGNDNNKIVEDNLTTAELNNVSYFRDQLKALYVKHLNKHPEAIKYMK